MTTTYGSRLRVYHTRYGSLSDLERQQEGGPVRHLASALFTGDEDTLDEFVDDDVVSMNVIVLGSLTYDTQVGGSTTVPLFSVEKITRKGSCD